MSKIRSKNTVPEKLLFEAVKPFYRRGHRYAKHYGKLPGKPDLVFLKQKLAVFVDSEFWHGKGYKSWAKRLPKRYWPAKILRNIARDKAVSSRLRISGWKVLRIWAKDLAKGGGDSAIRKISKALASKR